MTQETIVVGGTSGIGLELARRLAARGDNVVITGRDSARAQAVAAELDGTARGIALDLTRPQEIAGALGDVEDVRHIVLMAIERDENTVRDYNVERALRLVTLKLVGYSEVVHVLAERLADDGSVLIFGGLAKERPYPGSTTITTVNGGVTGLVRTMAVELAPIRVNAIHPGVVGDSPAWRDKPAEVLDGIRARTPTGRLVTMEDVVGASIFLLDNSSMNGADLFVDGGWVIL
jgi:NAD(P)-dependent dehydrogenase (short-subunit alcohol dehydrogenase family)